MEKTINKKIRVVSSNQYIIEVNDQGETIALDLTDLNLLTKLKESFTTLDKISKSFTKKIKNIENKDISVSDKEEKQLQLLNTFYKDSRSALDSFLGDGACQKIFGDHNFITMFDDLAKALEPCFEDMKEKVIGNQKNLRSKYITKAKKDQVKL